MPLISRFLGVFNVPLLLMMAGLVLFAYYYGANHTQLRYANQQVTQVKQELADTIETINRLTTEAMQASKVLSEQVAARSAADAKSTKEIKHVLKNLNRQSCVFSADIMQQLEAARQRANQAITGGLNDTLSHIERTGR